MKLQKENNSFLIIFCAFGDDFNERILKLRGQHCRINSYVYSKQMSTYLYFIFLKRYEAEYHISVQ